MNKTENKRTENSETDKELFAKALTEGIILRFEDALAEYNQTFEKSEK